MPLIVEANMTLVDAVPAQEDLEGAEYRDYVRRLLPHLKKTR